MMDVRFGKIFVMHPDAAEKIKTIHRLPERDAYVGKVSNNDPEMLKGDYVWWGLPDKSMMFVTANDIDRFHQYENKHDVPLYKTKGEEQAFYNKLSQRAQNFVNEQAADGRKIHLIGAPLLVTIAHEAKDRLSQWTEFIRETAEDVTMAFKEYFGNRNI